MLMSMLSQLGDPPDVIQISPMTEFNYPQETNFGFSTWSASPHFNFPPPTALQPDPNFSRTSSLGDPSTYKITYSNFGELITCTVCNVSCTGPISYEQHLRGSHHRRNVQPKENFNCELCNTSFTSLEQRDAHLNGQKHREKLLTVSVADSSVLSNPPSAPGPFKCIPCHLECTSLSQLNQHLVGKKHAKVVKLQRYKRNSGSEFSVSASGSECSHLINRVPQSTPDTEQLRTNLERGRAVSPLSSDDPMSRLIELESTLSGLHLSSLPSLLSCYTNTNAPNSIEDTSDRLHRADKRSDFSKLKPRFCTHQECVVVRALMSYEQTLRKAQTECDETR